MKRLIPLLLLAACGPADHPAPAPQSAPPPTAPEPPAPPQPNSPEQAAQVARDYFDRLNAGWYDKAWALWAGEGSASGLSREDFARRFEPYARYEATLGVPGRPEGAAGSIYLEIPVKVTATRKDGSVEQLAGTVTLRRVNDVPGSTPEQRSWRIHSVDLKPA